VSSVFIPGSAQVAALLKVPVVLVVNGGVGSAFDELALNIHACHAAGATVGGVLVNKIKGSKVEMVRDYFGRAVAQRWGLPLVGCIPFGERMDAATMMDFEAVFGTKLSSGVKHRTSRHFGEYELVVTDLNLFLERLHSGAFNDTLFVTHASRSDIVTGYLTYAATYERLTGESLKGGILLSGSPGSPFGAWPDAALRSCIEHSSIPILYTNVSTSETVRRLTHYVAKLNADDPKRTDAVVAQYSAHVDVGALLDVASRGAR
jgi:phosphate acetyltransferase